MNRRFPRRVFLQFALASLASACAAKAPLPVGPPPTPLPTITPTPVPSADGTAAAFLTAWSAGDYAAMYDLLVGADRLKMSHDQFRGTYTRALTEATATAVRTELRSLLHDGPRALAGFRAEWQTALFGPLNFDNQMPLVWEGEHWAVDWSTKLVLPQLSEDLVLVLLGQTPVRGNIYDRNGLGLAVDGRLVTIGVVPGWITDPATVIAQLSAITGIAADTIRGKIAKAQPEWFVPIADVSPEVSVGNDETLSALAGVTRRERTVRAYNGGDLAAHLIGYLGTIPPDELSTWQSRGYGGEELIGRSGVEGWGELYLAGRRGGRLVTLTRQNQEVSQIAKASPRPGDSIYMTIDKDLQADAERILGQRPGAIVVLDANTGFLLAVASYPRFDPTLFSAGIDQAAWAALNADTRRPLVGRGTQGAYPPGSVFKIIAMAAAMEKLGMTADTMFTCTGSWDKLGKQFTKTCWLRTGHGRINLQDGLTQSCDVVFYDIGLALQNADPQALPDYARAWGLGTATGVEGVEEAAGLVPDAAWKLTERGESWFPGDTVNLAIGQSYLLTTPLQIASLLAAVGNGGTVYRPQLIQRVAERSGAERISQPQAAGQLPVSTENLAVIRTGLEGVVSGKRGTARDVFAGAAFTAAGKTGTAEVGQEGAPHAWFAGYAPAEAPRVAIAVILEHAGEGSEEAAPVFRTMVEAILARQPDWGPR